MKLLYSKGPQDSLKRKDARKQIIERPRRVLIGLSLVLDFAGSVLVLLLSGSLEEAQEGVEQRPDEPVERGVVVEKEATVSDTVALRDELEEVV